MQISGSERQGDGDGKDAQQVGEIKDRHGNVLTCAQSVEEKEKKSFEELMEEELCRRGAYTFTDEQVCCAHFLLWHLQGNSEVTDAEEDQREEEL